MDFTANKFYVILFSSFINLLTVKFKQLLHALVDMRFVSDLMDSNLATQNNMDILFLESRESREGQVLWMCLTRMSWPHTNLTDLTKASRFALAVGVARRVYTPDGSCELSAMQLL